MASIFCCGFECGVATATATGAHWTMGSSATFNTSIVRNAVSGSKSIRLNPSASNQGHAYVPALFTSGTMAVVRFYFYVATVPSANTFIGGVDTTTPYLLGIGYYGPNNEYRLCADNQVGGGSANFHSVGVTHSVGWHRADLRINVAANPYVIEGFIDGTTLGTYQPAIAANTLVEFIFGQVVTSTFDIYFDDCIASITSGDFPFGAGYVLPFVPTADGTHNIAGTNDFERGTGGVDILNATTDAWQLVDDIPLQSGAPGTTDFINMVLPVNTTDYVECIFGPTVTSAPRTVEVIAGIAQAGTGTGNMQIRLNDNGTMGTIYTATGVAGVTTIALKRAHFADPPSAASVWTLTGNGNFNNLRVRFGSPGALDVNPDQYFTSIMAEAEFTGDPPVASTFIRDMLGMGIIPYLR